MQSRALMAGRLADVDSARHSWLEACRRADDFSGAGIKYKHGWSKPWLLDLLVRMLGAVDHGREYCC